MPELEPVTTWARQNVADLSGEKTINSVPLSAGVPGDPGDPEADPPVDPTPGVPPDTVLLANQTDPAENGIYVIKEGQWDRREDFAEPPWMRYATEVVSMRGGTYPHSKWRFVTHEVNEVGADPLQFRMVDRGYAVGVASQIEENAGGDLELTEVLENPGTYSGLRINRFGRVEDAVQPRTNTTHVEGLEVVYEGPTSLRVLPGLAWVPGESQLVELVHEAELLNLSLFPSTWYYLYLRREAGEGYVEISDEPPAEPYLGGARTKGGEDPDDSWRYIPNSAVYVLSDGTLRRFHKGGNFTRWVVRETAISGATNIVTAGVSIAHIVPPGGLADTALVEGLITNPDTQGSTLFISSANDGLQTVGQAPTNGQLTVGPTHVPGSGVGTSRLRLMGPVALFGATSLHYAQNQTGANRNHTINIHGYREAG